jgi:rhomboid protease GluP
MAAAFGKRGTQVRAFAPRPATVATAVPPALSLAPPPVAASHRAPTDFRTFPIPIVTPLLIVVLCCIFALQLQHAPGHFGMSLSGRTLAAQGALEGDHIFRAGEWWRLFTAPWMHASLEHLVGNLIVLGIVGIMLEPLIGPRWFAALYVAGGFGGALASAFLNPPAIPGVGASGAIMGVLGAAFLCGASATAGSKGRRMQT